MLPASARMRSWAAQSSASSGSAAPPRLPPPPQPADRAPIRPPSGRRSAASSRASRPAGLPRISWLRRGSSSRRSSSIARRSAGPSTSKKGSRPAALGVLAQQPLADLLPVADPELLVGPVEQRLDALAQPPGAWRGSRPGPAPAPAPSPPRPAGEAPRQRLGLAGPGRAEHQQRPLAVADARAPAASAKASMVQRYRVRLALHRMRLGGRFLRRLAGNLPPRRRRPAADLRRRCASIEARTVYEGVGEGGDRTLVIDRRCEDAVFAELEALAARGRLLRRRLRGARRGRLRRGRRGPGRDRPDRRLAQRPPHASLPQPQHRGRRRAPRWPTSSSATSTTSAPARSSSRGAARGATLGGEPIAVGDDGEKLELLGVESAEPEWLAAGDRGAGRQGLPPAGGRLDRDHRRLRRRGPLRRDAQPAPLPLGRRGRGAADRPRGGRRGRLRRSRARAGRPRSRRPLPDRRRDGPAPSCVRAAPRSPTQGFRALRGVPVSAKSGCNHRPRNGFKNVCSLRTYVRYTRERPRQETRTIEGIRLSWQRRASNGKSTKTQANAPPPSEKIGRQNRRRTTNQPRPSPPAPGEEPGPVRRSDRRRPPGRRRARRHRPLSDLVEPFTGRTPPRSSSRPTAPSCADR